MLDPRIQYALNNFYKSEYFEDLKDEYNLEESDKLGKSCLVLKVNGTNLCKSNFDGECKCGFLKIEGKYGMDKSVDHVVFQKVGDVWKIHLFEMKTTVGHITWEDIKTKIRTCYFKSKTLALFLGNLSMKFVLILLMNSKK